MNRLALPTLLCALLLGYSAALLAAKPPAGKPQSGKAAAAKKLYKWVGADGKVFYSDQIPPEQVNQQHQEKSARTGLTTETVDRALTEEERTQAQAEALKQHQAEQAQQDAARQLQARLDGFANEASLLDAYRLRLDAAVSSEKMAAENLAQLKKSRLSLLQRLADQELAGTKISAKSLASLQALHAQVVQQQQALASFIQGRQAITAERAAMLSLYRQRQAAPASVVTPAPAVLP